MWASRRHLLSTVLSLALIACAAKPVEDIAPGETPRSDSDEAGLWMMTERAERALVTSGSVVEDPELATYIDEIKCRLAPNYCNHIRIYVVDRADFNATMAPTGFMSIWTGLIVRCENEAQLATVIGHEIAHFQSRHSLLMWRSVQNSSNAWTVANLVLGAPVGVQYASHIAMVSGLMSFSREFEREADSLGLRMMVDAGYDPREASRLWDNLIEERNAAGVDDPLFLFATHPRPEDRSVSLREEAEELAAGNRGKKGTEAFLAATRSYRKDWLGAELRQRYFSRTEVLVDRLMQQGTSLGLLYYSRGELHRLRAQEGDLQRAVSSYEQSLQYEDTPVEVYRGMGFASWSIGDTVTAREAFEKYITLAEDAPDREMIRSHVEELR